LAIAGLAMFVVAGALALIPLRNPSSRINAPRLSLADFEMAVFPLFGGIVCFVAVLYFVRRWKWEAATPASKEAYENHQASYPG